MPLRKSPQGKPVDTSCLTPVYTRGRSNREGYALQDRMPSRECGKDGHPLEEGLGRIQAELAR